MPRFLPQLLAHLQLSPSTTLFIGIAIAFLAAFGMFHSFNKTAKFRWANRGGHGAPMSRTSRFLFMFTLCAFGLLMTNDYFHFLLPISAPAIVASLFGVLALAAARDAFNDWHSRGFPLIARCPHCRHPLDFQIASTQCPACQQNLPSTNTPARATEPPISKQTEN